MYTAEGGFNAEFTSWSTKQHDFGHPKISLILVFRFSLQELMSWREEDMHYL